MRMSEVKRGRGRPKKVLTEEEIEERKEKYRAYQKEYAKNNPEKIQKKWQKYYELHPEPKYYKVNLCLPLNCKKVIKKICKDNKTTATQIFIDAIYKKYGVDLKKQ